MCNIDRCNFNMATCAPTVNVTLEAVPVHVLLSDDIAPLSHVRLLLSLSFLISGNSIFVIDPDSQDIVIVFFAYALAALPES